MFLIFQAYYNPDGFIRKSSGLIAGKGTPLIGEGAFGVIDHNGQGFTEKNLEDKYSLIFFGYTYCPDVCPIGLSLLSSAYSELPKTMQNEVQIIFASVDPKRDTPEVLKEYRENFSANITALTGTKKQIDDLVKKYAVYYDIKNTGDDEYYLVDHSSYIYLIGPDGRYLKHFDHNVSVEKVVGELTQYLAK